MDQQVLAWTEQVTIPTYEVGKPEKNPVFLEKRVYQGSRGSVYPFPIIESISDIKKDKLYTAVFIENEFLKIMILPALGGRVQRAYDKIRNRDFIYYNQVIKPALVGLTGPWISGGIEFNWPQHHRPSTFEPVDFTIEEHNDGSKTIWTNEVELMSRTKGMTGFTLYKDKAYLEVKGRLFNWSGLPQTFLWWANPAIKVNEFTQSVFPPDVYAVFDHGKRDVSDFPIATGTYYKVNYAPGTDISWYKNIPVPTSYMAIQSEYDFIGSYEHDTQSGMLHVADHHISPGKKQWTWGTGDFGKKWENNLTDEDGPYIELMCGVFTDNQPDFSWIETAEEKSFEQYFFPYAGIGVVKNATKDAAINVEEEEDSLTVKVYATGCFAGSTILVKAGEQIVFETETNLSPRDIFIHTIKLPADITITDLIAEVKDSNGKKLVVYKKQPAVVKDIPPPASPAPKPAAIESTELLFLHGLHLEQYRHATYSPVDYYREALRRDALDSRSNNAMGLWYLRRGKMEAAEVYFRNAVARLVHRNPNPYDGEACYNLGWCLQLQGKTEAAFEAFYKSAWNDACQHKAYFQLARIGVRRGDFEEALIFIKKSLAKNNNNPSAHHLLVIILRKLGKTEEALAHIASSLRADPFNFGCYFERHLLHQSSQEQAASDALQQMEKLMRNAFNNYLEYALDYMHAGLYKEAYQLLNQYSSANSGRALNPLAYYYQAWLCLQWKDIVQAHKHFETALASKPDYCFPSKIEDIAILKTAIQNNPADYKACYYLGNFWYANGQYTDAIECWEQSVAINDRFPTAHRNLSLAYYNKLHNAHKATASMEKAFSLDEQDARVLMELDQLGKLTNKCTWQRLQLLEDHVSLVEQRDDLYLERITLYNQLGDYETASALLEERSFHPWEGGEGKVVRQFVICRSGLAKAAMLAGRYNEAAALLDTLESYPPNLGEGKLPGIPENEIHYLKGCLYSSLGMDEKAQSLFLKAISGDTEPRQAVFYNDPQPENIFYQGLAWMKLGEPAKGRQLFERLIQFGKEHKQDEMEIDYFAVSLPELLVFDQDLNRKNKLHCEYIIGLGMLGLNKLPEARASFNSVLRIDQNHQGALLHLGMMTFLNSYDNQQKKVGHTQGA